MGNVQGTVTDAITNTPVSGVTVMIGGKNDATGDAGTFIVENVPVGARRITASKNGYKTGSGSVEVKKGITSTYNIQLSPDESASGDLGNVEGTVKEQGAGTMVSAATVQIGDKTGLTQGSGYYSINGVGIGDRIIMASKSGYQTYTGTVTIQKGITVVHNIDLTKGSTTDTQPPSVPTGLTAIAVSSDRIDIIFNPSTDNVKAEGYKVYRSGSEIATSAVTSYSDKGLTASTQYCYTVTAYDAAGNMSAKSAQACAMTMAVTDTTAPSVPTNLVANAVSSSGIELTWSASPESDVPGYKVYRDGAHITTATAAAYSDTGLTGNTQYCYQVSSIDTAGNESVKSSQSCATTQQSADVTPPSVPTGLVATVMSSSQIDLSWTASSDPSTGSGQASGVAGYKVYRGGAYIKSSTANSASDFGLSASTPYCYTVSALDAAGNESAVSTEVCGTTGTSDGTLKWSYTTGNSIYYSSPAIGSDGTIYVGSEDYKVYALYPDGTLKWSFTTGGNVHSSPAIGSDGTIYVGSASGDNKLYAINSNGTLKWSYTTGDVIWSSPAIGSDGTIYVGSYGNSAFYAINPDGTLKWIYGTGYLITSSPAIGSDGTVYVGSYDNKLYAINSNGTLKWSYTTGSTIASSPAIGSDGTIYVGSYDNKLYAINSDGTLKWSYATLGQILASPAIDSGGTVYIGSLDNKLYAINSNGTLKWSYTTGGEIYSSPAIGSDGTIYVGSYDNKLYAINSDGTLKWFYTTGGHVTCQPSIGLDGTVYVGSYDNKLYAINSSSMGLDANAQWPKFHHDNKNTGNVKSFTAFNLPDTGQTTSYTSTFGEDADYTINPMSFTDNGNSTITDNNTGLMWQKQDDDVTRNWADAGTYCDGLSLGGQTDWRLPNEFELMSIVDYGKYNPAIDPIFMGTSSAFYWSTTSAYVSSVAWGVAFDFGDVYSYDKATGNGHVRCVRGQSTPTQSFTDNGNGTVTDNNTDLIWQKEDDNTKRIWEQAITYCEGLSLGGYSDWRLPNIKKLESIVDDTKYGPAINANFPNTDGSYDYSHYWSSTTKASATSNALYVKFDYGFTDDASKSGSAFNVRCVR